jgi:hypothetical protein
MQTVITGELTTSDDLSGQRLAERLGAEPAMTVRTGGRS